MNPFTNPTYLLPPLVAAVFSGSLCVLVGLRAFRSAAHRYFALFLLIVGAWSLLTFLMRSSPNVESALFWERFLIPVMLTSTPAFFSFTKAYTRVDEWGIASWLLLAYLVVTAALGATGLLVDAMTVESYGYAPTFGSAFYPLAAWGYLWIFLGLFGLYRAYRRSKSYEERNRLQYIMAATMFPVIGTALDIFPWTYPTNILGNLVFASVTTVAMRRYHLLDIRMVIRKSVAYVVVSTMVAVPYVAIILTAQRIFPSGQARTVVYFLLLTTLAFALQPLWNRVQAVVNTFFLRQRRDSFRAMEEFTRRSHSLAELAQPAREVVDVIRKAMGADGVALLQPEQTGEFASVAISGRESIGRLRIGQSGPLALYLDREKTPLEVIQLDFVPRLQALSDQERQALQAAGVVLLVPLRMRDHLSGILALSAKRSEAPYTREEMTLLTLVATQTAVLLDDARLYEGVRLQLEQDHRRREAFHAAVSHLALAEDPARALQELVDTARNLVGARSGVLEVWDRSGEVVRRISSPDGSTGLESDESVGPRRMDGLLADERAISSLPKESRYPLSASIPPVSNKTRNILKIPISVRGQPGGVLLLQAKDQTREFSPNSERLAGLFAGVAGVLLGNADLYISVTQEKSTLATILGSMAEGLVVLGTDSRVALWNKAMEVFTGIPGRDAVGQRFDALMSRMVPFLENQEVLDKVRLALAYGKEAITVFEVALVSPQRRELLVRGFHIPTETDQVLLGLLVRDVTQDKELEERRNSFISIVSHELRTPMTTIVGFSEILLKQEVPKPVQQDWLGSIHKEGLRLSGIVDDLLDVSRIQSGKLGVTLGAWPIAEVIQEAMALARPMATRHQLSTDVPPAIPEVWADKTKLVQVITNLLTNAVKYSPERSRVTVSARYEPDRQRIVIGVSDQGIGIAPEHQKNLFQSFQRVNRQETLGIRGTGLGLYIVKSFVEMMDGEVWVESILGSGSTFYVSLAARQLDSVEKERRMGEQHAKKSVGS